MASDGNLITNGDMSDGAFPYFLQVDCPTNGVVCTGATLTSKGGLLEVVSTPTSLFAGHALSYKRGDLPNDYTYALKITTTDYRHLGSSVPFDASPGDTFRFTAYCQSVGVPEGSANFKARIFIFQHTVGGGSAVGSSSTRWCAGDGQWTRLEAHLTVQGADATRVRLRIENNAPSTGDEIRYDGFQLVRVPSPPRAPSTPPLPHSPPLPPQSPPPPPAAPSTCEAWIVGDIVTASGKAEDAGQYCGDESALPRRGWDDRLAVVLQQVFGITVTKNYAINQNALDQILAPNASTSATATVYTQNEAFHADLSKLLSTTTGTPAVPADPNPDPSTVGASPLFLISGFGFETGSNHLMESQTLDEARATTADFEADLAELVRLAKAYGINPFVAGHKPNAYYPDWEALELYASRARLANGSAVPDVSVAEGTYADFLDGPHALHSCTDAATAVSILRSGVPLVGNGDEYNHYECSNYDDGFAQYVIKSSNGAIIRQKWNPNLFGHIQMYRALPLAAFEAAALARNCNPSYAPRSYTLVVAAAAGGGGGNGGTGTGTGTGSGTGSGRCSNVDATPLATLLGDVDADDSAFTARLDACQLRCSATAACVAVTFMSNASIGRQNCSEAVVDREPPLPRECTLHAADTSSSSSSSSSSSAGAAVTVDAAHDAYECYEKVVV